MSSELHYLIMIAAFTALMWIPYILNRIAVSGMTEAVGYPEHPKPLAAWAARLKSAHSNAIENLAVFATLVIAANLAGVSNDATVAASAIYFWARVAHALVYALGIPYLRTLAFAVGWVATLTFAWQLLA